MKKKSFPERFSARFSLYSSEMKELYFELYHNNKAFDSFCDMLYRMWSDRSVTMREIDDVRSADPNWYRKREMLGMQLYVGAFAKDLNGVRNKLDYIQECGVNYLHLMPLLESPKGRSDGGYAVADFRKVQPELGTMEDLSRLAADCHQRGISVCLDFVMNHTSEDHTWAKRAKAGEKEYQDRYFFYDDWTIPNQFEKDVPQVFPTTAPGNFTWCEEAGKVVMTTFYPYQWDLNYANPALFQDMTENMLYLCNQGIDIIRLDAVPYIWKELGTNCRNLPEVHKLTRLMRIACEIVCPGTLLLGEVVMEPSEVVPYFGTVEKPECHLLYNVTTMASTWHTVATKDTRLLRNQLDKIFSLPREYGFLNYLRCHDDIGWGLDYPFLKWFGIDETLHKKYLNDYFTGKWPGSPARGELYNDDPKLGDARLCGTTASLCGIESALEEQDGQALERALNLDIMLHAYMFTLSGIPVLYSGDEVAAVNDYSYHRDPDKAADSRYLHRGNMNWDAAGRRRDETTPEGKLFRSLRELEKQRACHRCFDSKADVWTLNIWDQCMLGIGRYYNGEKLIAIYNFSDAEKRTTLWNEEGDLYDIFTGMVVNKREIVIPPNGFLWLICDFDDPDRGKKRNLLCLNWDQMSQLIENENAFSAAVEKWNAARAAGDKTLVYSKRFLTEKELEGFINYDALVCADGACIMEDGKYVLDYPIPDLMLRKILSNIKSKQSKALTEPEAAPKNGDASHLPGKVYCLHLQNISARNLSDIRKHLSENYAISDVCPRQNARYDAEIVNQKFDLRSGIRRVAEGYGIAEENTYDFMQSILKATAL